MVRGEEREGFATATLLLVDISKVKLLKGNSTSKNKQRMGLRLVDRRVRRVRLSLSLQSVCIV